HQLSDAELIDKVPRHRHGPCLKQNESREYCCYFRVGHSRECLSHAWRKERKSILIVGDDDHGDDAAHELDPPVSSNAAVGFLRAVWRFHSYSSGSHICFLLVS